MAREHKLSLVSWLPEVAQFTTRLEFPSHV